MKCKKIALLLATVMMMSLTGCGGSPKAENDAQPSPEQNAEQTEGPEEAEQAEAGGEITSTDKVEINIASVMNDGLNEIAAQDFKEKVEAATNGNITVNLLLAGTSGSETENLNQVSSGELEIALGGSNYPQQILTEYNATGIPFLFSSYDDVETFWDTYWDEMEAISLQNNIRCLGLMRRGARDLTTNDEVKEPADVQGMKLRLPDNATWKVVWESLGATCTPVNMQEVYTALQTGVVGAQENPIGTTVANNLQEVQKYNVLTHHLVQHFEWLINEDFWQGLPADYQKLIAETIDYECQWAVAESERIEEEFRAQAEEQGMTFVEIDAAAWRTAAKDGILEAASTMNEETQNYVKQVLGE